MLNIKIIKENNFDAVILDDLHSDLFQIINKNKKILIIPIRNIIPIVLNFKFFKNIFFFYCKNKFKLKKLKENYLIILFKYVNAPRVITYFENTYRISLLKKNYPKKNFFTFTNGLRAPGYNFKHDKLLTWGNFEKKLDKQKKFKSNKYCAVGSLRLLNYLNERKILAKKKIDIIYISAFSKIYNHNYLEKFNKVTIEYEIKLLRNISKLVKKDKYNFKILMKSEVNDKYYNDEVSYFKKYFNKSVLIRKRDYKDSYKYIDSSEVTISLVSALGLEALSLNTKVLLGFSIKDLQDKLKFYPELKSYGKELVEIISLKKLSEASLEKKIKNLLSIPNLTYNSKIYKVKKILSNDPDLTKIKKIIYGF